jgi:hypothetical protein
MHWFPCMPHEPSAKTRQTPKHMSSRSLITHRPPQPRPRQ